MEVLAKYLLLFECWVIIVLPYGKFCIKYYLLLLLRARPNEKLVY